MIQSLKDMLIAWNADRNERVKLQYAYITGGLLGIIAAGLVGLVNDELSRTILQISLIAIGVFVANALAWAILYGLVITKLPSRRVSTTPRK